MKQFIFILLVSISFFQCSNEKKIDAPPIFSESEETENQDAREEWIESMHRTAEGTSWRKIELQNRLELIKQKKNISSRDGEVEVLADSLLCGEWFELGSKNQSGSVHVTEYVPETDLIWTIADGGTLYKGKRDGSQWTVVNDDYEFGRPLLKFIPYQGGKRLVASISGIPAYSDDEGENWNLSTGIQIPDERFSGTRNYIVQEIGNDVNILCLSRESRDSIYHLYLSRDFGVTYKDIKNCGTSLTRSLALMSPNHSDRIFLMTKGDDFKATIEEVFVETETTTVVAQPDLLLGEDERTFLAGYQEGSELTLLSLDVDNHFQESKDLGQTWTDKGQIDARPWSVGFYVCPSNPEMMFFGGFECYRSPLGGQFWTKINDWVDYYDDVYGSLHADIMYFNEFQTSNGTPFQLISNHGGLSISYNYLQTVENIGLEGLNVSQYYDVRTDPTDKNYIYAGSQDQGWQRGRIDQGDGPYDLEQATSGDFGHFVFTNEGDNLWMIYPTGRVRYYEYPKTQTYGELYEIDSENESVWLPPMVGIPGSSENKVYVAGGSATGGPGSYIIELTYAGFSYTARNLPFDFYDYSEGEVSAIEVSPLNPNLMYASTTNGFFFYSTDAGQNWELSMIVAPEPHYLYGTSIYASQIDENVVYIAGSGYDNPAIYYSDDMGQTFTAFDEGLPSTLVFELTANNDETMFFAATELGPFVYLQETDSWHSMHGKAAPTTRYWSVEWLSQERIARFGTYGRGIWDFQVNDAEVVMNVNTTKEQIAFKIFPNPVGETLNIELPDPKIDFVHVYNSIGQLVLNKSFNNTEVSTLISLDVSKFEAGNYVVKLGRGNAITSKTMIKN